MELMAVIDKELNELDRQTDYNKQKVFVWKILIFNNSVEFCINLAGFVSQKFYELNMSGFVFVFTAYGFLLNHLLITQFTVAVWLVQERFKAIHEVLR